MDNEKEVYDENLEHVTIDENKFNGYFHERDSLAENNIVEEVKAVHEDGRPILIGTITIEKSEELSQLLKREKIRHNVLNAKNHQQESEIIAQAGRMGAVTIATNMAGRGTDILLGGNPEFLAKQKMRELGFNDAQLEFCTSFVETDNQELNEMRERYRKAYKESSIKELAEIITLETGKSISKSGMNHRMRKIKDLADSFEKADRNKNN